MENNLNNNVNEIKEREIDLQKTFDKVLVVEKDDIQTNGDSMKPIFTICGGKIPVYKNDRFLAAHGALIACITISSETYNPFIIVDSYFDQLSFNAKLFAIYHELGHYQNGDFLVKPKESLKKELKYKFKRFVKEFIKGGYDEREVLADYYACDKMNSIQSSLDALNEINDLLVKMVSSYNNNKIINRVKATNEKRMRSINDMIINGPYFIDEERKEFEVEYVIEEDELKEKSIIEDNIDEGSFI